MIISSHQSSFLPYLGFWARVHASDVFCINEASAFSDNAMYHRTFMPKNPEKELTLDYLRVAIDPEKDQALLEVRTKGLVNQLKLKQQFETIINRYPKDQRVSNFKDLRSRFLALFDQPHDKLASLNRAMFEFVHKELQLKSKIVFNEYIDGFDKTNDNKTLRLIERIEYVKWASFQWHKLKDEKTIYLSGPSGRKYVDPEIWNANTHIKMHTQYEIKPDYYHGSIIHFLFTMKPEDIKTMLETHFIFAPFALGKNGH